MINQLWKVSIGAWKYQNEVLHNGKNNTISQSEHEEKVEMYYSRKGEISSRDVHLFGMKVELLTVRNRKNEVFRKGKMYFLRLQGRAEQDKTRFRLIFLQNNKENHQHIHRGTATEREISYPNHHKYPILQLT